MFTVTERAIDAIKGFVEKQQGSHVIRILSQPVVAAERRWAWPWISREQTT
jgi:hypothetical protein